MQPRRSMGIYGELEEVIAPSLLFTGSHSTMV